MDWKRIDTGCRSAKENMEIDKKLLDTLSPEDPPILHLYDWNCDSTTYGYFIKPDRFLDLKNAEKRGISLARRPTGGGIVFHTFDLAFSVLVPSSHPEFSKNTLQNYRLVNDRVLEAVKKFLQCTRGPELLPRDPSPLDEACLHFCMAKPTIYDVMLEGKKVAGAAQRCKKQGLLHQGTISLAAPNQELLSALLLPDTKVLRAMQQNTFTLLEEGWTKRDLEEARGLMRKCLEETFLLNR